MLTPRFETHRPMLLAGIRRVHRFADAMHGIPAQWEEFAALGTLPGQRGRVAYGAMCGVDEGATTMEYMTAVEVESFDLLPAGMGRMRLPEQRYAVFTHPGAVATLRATWDAIWKEWLPASGLRPANTPDFERYGEGFDPRTGSGDIGIWFPVGVGAGTAGSA